MENSRINIQEPLVSVIIPLYNAEKYIKATIDCLLNQSYQNIEIIVIDDFSTDQSFQLVSQLKSEKIKLKQNKTKGACAARNYGFEISKGDYIQYLDADDLLSTNKIESQLNLIKNTPNAIASCGWGKFIDTITGVDIKEQGINKNYPTPYQWLVDAWLTIEMGLISVWLTPRSVIEKAGKWDEKLLINQDGEFFCRVILTSSCILFSEEAIAFYRINPDGITQTKRTPEKITSQLYSYQLCEQHLTPYFDDINAKKAIGNLYLKFIYLHYGEYPAIVQKAWEAFNALNIGKPWAIGGKALKLLSKLIGFKPALKIKHTFKLR